MELVELEGRAARFIKSTPGRRPQDLLDGLAELVRLIRIVKQRPPQCGPASGSDHPPKFGQADLLVDPVKGGGGHGKIEAGQGKSASSKLEITTSRLGEDAASRR